MAELIQTKDVSQPAVQIITKAVTTLLESQPTVVLALPGGRSIVGTLKQLTQTTIPWQRVHVFMVDERLVPIDDEQSNFKQLTELLLNPLLAIRAIPKENIHPFVYQPGEADSGIGRYETELKRFGGRYDIVFLGVGEDGHTAALFPRHHSISDQADYYLTMADSPKPPPKRMTASRSLLTGARYGIALFVGETKRQALERYQDKNQTIKDCPVKLIDEIEHSYVVTDLL